MSDRTQLRRQNLIHALLTWLVCATSKLVVEVVHLLQQLLGRQGGPSSRHVVALQVSLEDGFQIAFEVVGLLIFDGDCWREVVSGPS